MVMLPNYGGLMINLIFVIWLLGNEKILQNEMIIEPSSLGRSDINQTHRK